MPERIAEESEKEVLSSEFSDEALEAAACPDNTGAYTQLGLCTLSLCNG